MAFIVNTSFAQNLANSWQKEFGLNQSSTVTQRIGKREPNNLGHTSDAIGCLASDKPFFHILPDIYRCRAQSANGERVEKFPAIDFFVLFAMPLRSGVHNPHPLDSHSHSHTPSQQSQLSGFNDRERRAIDPCSLG